MCLCVCVCATKTAASVLMHVSKKALISANQQTPSCNLDRDDRTVRLFKIIVFICSYLRNPRAPPSDQKIITHTCSRTVEKKYIAGLDIRADP